MSAPPSVRNLLRAWWHGRPARGPQPVGLGVAGLPHGVGHLPEDTPAVLLVQDEPALNDWAAALAADLLAAGPALVLAARSDDLDALLREPALRQAHAAARLHTWLLPAQAQARLRRDGLGGLVRELERVAPARQAGLCLLDANALLAGATVAEQQRLGLQLRRWCATRRRPLALLLPLHRSPPQAGSDLGAAVRAQAALFSHVAELGGRPGHPVLTLHRWNGAQGAVFDARYDLRLDAGPAGDLDDGPAAALAPAQGPVRLAYAGSFSLGAVPVLADAPDQFAVYATQAVVQRQRGVPATWHIAPTLAALEEAARDAVGATLVLDAGLPAQFEAVAGLVHRLRQSRPRSLKIIVRETDSKLRQHSEQALLRLGATAVVYREVGFSRLLQLIEDSHRQVHTRPVESDYAQALAEFMPVPERGYQPPQRFAQLVAGMLERTEAAGLAHCLVRLQLLENVAHLDALRACRAQRDADLVTADAQALYVFLFACRESDVDLALTHLFTLPLGQLFSSQTTDATASGMSVMLDRLSDAAPGLPDYTALLDPVAPLPRPAAPAAVPVRGPAAPALPPAPGAAAAAGPAAPALQVHARPIGRRSAPSGRALA